LKHLVAHLAAPARLLISAKRHRRIENTVAIDPNRSGAKLGGDAMSLLDVAGPNGRRKSILCVVGLGDQIIDIAKWHLWNHGSETFLAHVFHLFVGIEEHGRFHEVAFVSLAAPTGNGFGALRESRFKIAANAVELLFGN